jgi:ribosome maturation factor RimP
MGRWPIFRFWGWKTGCSMFRETLEHLLRPVVEGLGFELWELEYFPRRGNALLRLYLDSPRGVTLDDCESVSRAVSEVLDAQDPLPDRYALEVSSPGLERPLRTPEQFARFVGENVYVELVAPIDGRRRLTGPLAAVSTTTIEVTVDGQRHAVPIAAVRKAHLAPEF